MSNLFNNPKNYQREAVSPEPDIRDGEEEHLLEATSLNRPGFNRRHFMVALGIGMAAYGSNLLQGEKEIPFTRDRDTGIGVRVRYHRAGGEIARPFYLDIQYSLPGTYLLEISNTARCFDEGCIGPFTLDEKLLSDGASQLIRELKKIDDQVDTGTIINTSHGPEMTIEIDKIAHGQGLLVASRRYQGELFYFRLTI